MSSWDNKPQNSIWSTTSLIIIFIPINSYWYLLQYNMFSVSTSRQLLLEKPQITVSSWKTKYLCDWKCWLSQVQNLTKYCKLFEFYISCSSMVTPCYRLKPGSWLQKSSNTEAAHKLPWRCLNVLLAQSAALYWNKCILQLFHRLLIVFPHIC